MVLEKLKVQRMTSVRTLGRRLNSEVEKRTAVWKTSDNLGSFTVDESNGKWIGGGLWKNVSYRTVIDRDTGVVLERAECQRPLGVAESTLIRQRNITATLNFRLRGHEHMQRRDRDEHRVAVSKGFRHVQLFGSR